MTEHEDMPYIRHILDAIKDIEASINGLAKNEFVKSKDVKEANIRRIEIIGEAVKNISNSLKIRHPEIEWAKIAGTRDKMIHHYFGVDLDVVWGILKKDIPVLKQKIMKIKKELESNSKSQK